MHAPIAPFGRESTPSITTAERPDSPTVLRVADLTATYGEGSARNVVVDSVSFDLAAGQVLCLVGGSGSGKTTLARTVLGLHQPTSGRIELNGSALASRAKNRSVAERRQVQVVFQNPMDAINPRHTVSEVVGRAGRVLRGLRGKELEREVLSCLEQVRLTSAFLDKYPNEVSGGELQRVGIARALIASPQVIVCDEVTSALDVSVQAAILELLADLSRKQDIALLFITHDLGVVSTIADEVMVMRNGVICESGSRDSVLRDPQHEYSRTLIQASPGITDALALMA